MSEAKWRRAETNRPTGRERQRDQRRVRPEDRGERSRAEEPPLEDQLADFISASQSFSMRGYSDYDGRLHEVPRVSANNRRRTLRTEAINLSLKRTEMHALGNVYGNIEGIPLRDPVDCLDIDDFWIYRPTQENPLGPLEEFIQIAFRDFPGGALNFQNVTDPEVASWCESHGWTKREKMGQTEPDYHLLLPPFAERQQNSIITTSWSTKKNHTKEVPALPPAEVSLEEE